MAARPPRGCVEPRVRRVGERVPRRAGRAWPRGTVPSTSPPGRSVPLGGGGGGVCKYAPEHEADGARAGGYGAVARGPRRAGAVVQAEPEPALLVVLAPREQAWPC
jgi:hypothetical protein